MMVWVGGFIRMLLRVFGYVERYVLECRKFFDSVAFEGIWCRMLVKPELLFMQILRFT